MTKTSKTLVCLLLANFSFAEVFVYEAENGNRIISDRPLKQVNLKLLAYGEPGNAVNAGKSFGMDQQYDALMKQASMLYGVEFALIKAVIRAESAFDPMAVSSKGAQGLMQLMPLTAQRYGVENVFDAKENIYAGTRYLRYLLNVYNQNTALALAAYNAGETAVNEYQGIPPFEETEFYVQKVLAWYSEYQ